MTSEKARVEEISANSLYAAGVMPKAIRYCHNIVRRYLSGGKVLEMGPAEGIMTELLVQEECELTLLEGSSLFCEQLSKSFPNAKVINCLFEDYFPDERYDTIILGHVLEHVEDPTKILCKVKEWLKPNGRIFAAVPNALSIHRQAAVLMNLLPKENSLNSLDIHHGHRRVFDPTSFQNIFIEAGLRIDKFGGYWLKPISNRQIQESWTEEMVDAFMILGERYPEIAGEIYVISSDIRS